MATLTKAQTQQALGLFLRQAEGKMTGTVLYSRELFDRLCDGIAQNLSVTDAAKSVGVTKQCLYKWLLPTHPEHEYNRAAFAVAKSLQADYAFDNLSRIAAPVPGEDAVSVAARRLQYDAEKWRTSKMDSKYSDRSEVNHTGQVDSNIKINVQFD